MARLYAAGRRPPDHAAISQAVETSEDASRDVRWILSVAGLAPGARVLDAPCGFGRHSIELARHGFRVTGVDFNETELGRARSAAETAGVALELACADIRDMEFQGEFDLAVNLFSSIGYFSDDEDRLLLDRFWRALASGGAFVIDTRNRTRWCARCRPRSGDTPTTGRSASSTRSTCARVGGRRGGTGCRRGLRAAPAGSSARARSASTRRTSSSRCSDPTAGAASISTEASTARRFRSTRRASCSWPGSSGEGMED